MNATAQSDARWQDDLYELLRGNDVTQFAYVPDAGHRAGAGIKRTMTIGAKAEIPAGTRLIREGNGTSFVLIRVAATPPPKFKRNLDASACRDRFRAALLS